MIVHALVALIIGVTFHSIFFVSLYISMFIYTCFLYISPPLSFRLKVLRAFYREIFVW